MSEKNFSVAFVVATLVLSACSTPPPPPRYLQPPSSPQASAGAKTDAENICRLAIRSAFADVRRHPNDAENCVVAMAGTALACGIAFRNAGISNEATSLLTNGDKATDAHLGYGVVKCEGPGLLGRRIDPRELVRGKLPANRITPLPPRQSPSPGIVEILYRAE